MTKYLISILIFLSAQSFSQNTKVIIEGVSVFKIGDTITRITDYGYYFNEIILDDNYNFSEKHNRLDKGLNFCANSRVFFCDNVTVDEFEFDRGATLTYYNNKLIDIQLHDFLLSDSKITDIFKLKYGSTYGKIFLEGYKYDIKNLKANGVKITPKIDDHLQGLYLKSIYWTNGNVTISVGVSNKTYDFAERKYMSTGLAEGGVSVRNNKEYEKLIDCSNIDYQKKNN